MQVRFVNNAVSVTDGEATIEGTVVAMSTEESKFVFHCEVEGSTFLLKFDGHTWEME